MADVEQYAQCRKHKPGENPVNRLIATRWSHLVGYSGVGAVVRADNDLYVIEDISQWTDRAGVPAGEVIPYVEIACGTLGIHAQLRQPPASRTLPNGQVDGVCIPAIRFPGWMRCPSCGLLHWLPWKVRASSQSSGEDPAPPRCSCERHPRLQQIGWVLAHPEGGLEEVPWHALAHLNDPSRAQTCRVQKADSRIYLRRDAQAGTRWKLKCKSCGAIEAEFQPNRPWEGGDPRSQPWHRSEAHGTSTGKLQGKILEVSDPGLYFPRIRQALVIPPESRAKRGTVLDRLYCNRADLVALERARTDLARRQNLQLLAKRYRCTSQDVNDALDELQQGYPLYGQTATQGDLMAKEYEAFHEQIPDRVDSEDFVPRDQTAEWHAQPVPEGGHDAKIVAVVDRVMAITRLREVRIFEGFTRISQHIDDGLRPVDASAKDQDVVKSKLVLPDLGKGLDWLPGIELFGEGIFFTLSESALRRWGGQPALRSRAQTLDRRFVSTGVHFPDAPISPLAPRFVLLHTLAHLLIRQLETQAGYPAASIRERIYWAEGDEPMAGILVYVAVPDIVGSLGGLAELAEPARFLRLLSGVFTRADWCSLDPVCAEHEGQGPSQLNRAACHACALIPEPSCQFRNLLLDRVFIRGDLKGEIRPILDFVSSER